MFRSIPVKPYVRANSMISLWCPEMPSADGLKFLNMTKLRETEEYAKPPPSAGLALAENP